MKIEKKYNYFYKITNDINGDYYYGVHSTNNLNDNYMGSGVRLRSAYKIYGKENFTKEIIKFFDTRKEALKLEENVVTPMLVEDQHCYNSICGGRCGSRGFKMTLEQRQVQSKNAKKQWADDELRKHNSEANKKAWSNPDLKAKHSKTMKQCVTDDVRKKRSEAMKKRWQDPNYVKWQKEINSGKNNPMYGKIPHNKKY